MRKEGRTEGREKKRARVGWEVVDLSTGQVIVSHIVVRGQHLVSAFSSHTFHLFETGSLVVPCSVRQDNWPTKYTGSFGST